MADAKFEFGQKVVHTRYGPARFVTHGASAAAICTDDGHLEWVLLSSLKPPNPQTPHQSVQEVAMSEFKFGDLVVTASGSRGIYLRHSDRSGHFVSTGATEFYTESVSPVSPPPNTVPVRIAVAVTADGRWDAQGNSEGPASRMMDWANENVGYDSRITFINGYAFLPEQPAEVAGTVERGEGRSE